MIVFVFFAVAILIASIVLLIGEVRAYLTRTRNKQQVCALKQALKSSKLNWASIAWMSSLTLLCVGILTNGYLYPSAALIPIGSGAASLHPMDLRAYNIQYGLLLWLVFKNTIGRNQGGVKSTVSSVAISGSVLGVALINSWQSAIAINEIQRQVPAQGE